MSALCKKKENKKLAEALDHKINWLIKAII